MAKKPKIDYNKILATAKADIQWADDYYEEHIEKELIRRYDVYFSERERYKKLYPKLSEQNQMRTFDFWSAVEWLLPNLLRAFFGSDRIISISGVESEDADRAERVMKLIQWQLTVKNQGYRIFKNWFTDALTANLGVLKCYWKRETKPVQHQEEMDEQRLIGILQNPENKILASEPVMSLQTILGFAPPMVNVTWIENQVTVNQPVIEVVRPSDIRFTPDGRTLGECSMVAHRKIIRVDQLRRDAARGMYDDDAVDRATRDISEELKYTELEQRLNEGVRDSTSKGSTENARTKVVVYECYLKSDINDDGMLEDVIVTVCNGEMLRAVENPYGRAPFFDLVPFWDSYQVWARVGLAELVQDVQDSHTALLRQMLIALGLSNQPRIVYDETAINVDDLNNDSMFIRKTSSAPMGDVFFPLLHPGLRMENFKFFEYLKTQIEEWTPTSRYNQGLDASSLNKTATGISMIMSAAQQRHEEIIRNFAETGIRELFRFLIQINQRYLDQAQVVRLQNNVLEFSPDDLNGDYDLSVDASAGVAARDAKVAVLTQYLREMFPFALQIGAAGPEQFIRAGQKLLQLMGVEDADKYLEMPQQMMLPQFFNGGGGGSIGGAEGAGGIPQGQIGAGGPQGGAGAGGAGGIGGILPG